MKKRLLPVLLCMGIVLCTALPAPAQTIPVWQPNTAYAIGALVMFNSVEYKCIQAHTSQVGWEPPNVPALWQPVSGTPAPSPTPTPTPTPKPTPPPTPTPTPAPTPTPSPTPAPTPSPGGLPKHLLMGYWQDFNNGAKCLRISDVPTSYDIIAVAFADATTTPGAVSFTL